SIGPFHHGRKELKAMEEYKLRYSKQFLQRTQMFEALHCETNHVNDYAMFFSLLVSSAKDTELLIQNGIIENTGSVHASTIYQEL
ncbi:hypothetical protein Ddye_023033, partial [Dipteronia dyeriana]